MATTKARRPVERRVERWAASGLTDAEIGRRFRRSERWAKQVQFLAEIERPDERPQRRDRLRPLERRLLRWREQGVDHAELSHRFRRSAAHLARVESYARHKLASS